MLDLIVSSQNDLVDNDKVHEHLGSSEHNRIHFNITLKQGKHIKTNDVELLQRQL